MSEGGRRRTRSVVLGAARRAMAALRPSDVLLLSWALLAGASYYVRRLEVVSEGLLSESAAPSRISCAAGCDRTTGCVGFTLTSDGLCQLFNRVLFGSTSTSSGAVQVQYIRPFCPPGWHLYRDSCYLRRAASVELNWDESRAACQRLGSDLASLNDQAEQVWMMHHPSRTSVAEFIGVRLEAGTFTNVDGTTPSFEPPLSGEVGLSSSCLQVKSNDMSDNDMSDSFLATDCSSAANGYTCEAPLHRSPCPSGWLALDDHCYHYVSSARAWQEADDHCAGLQTGARLSPVINMGIWHILYQNFGTGWPILVGISDQATEGSFQSIDGTDWSITWWDGEPSNWDPLEDCVAVDERGANDVPCTDIFVFLCRAPISA